MNRCLLVVAILTAISTSGFGQEASNGNSPCSLFPCIVASVSLINQTASVSQVPIYTPATSGTLSHYLLHGI